MLLTKVLAAQRVSRCVAAPEDAVLVMYERTKNDPEVHCANNDARTGERKR